MNQPKQRIFDYLYKYGTLVTIVILLAFFSLFADNFLQSNNIINILRSISIVTIIATGLTFSLAVGGFDLSVGSIAYLADALAISLFVWYGQDTVVGIAIAVLAAIACGALNALLVVKIKIPDMLATLATMFILQGLALTYARGATISQNMVMPDGNFANGLIPKFFVSLGQVPWIIIIMVVVTLLVHVFLNYTKHGRYLYMIGGNLEAARLSGISVNRYRALAYILSALLAAIGGLVLAARIQTTEINAGAPYLMDAVAAAYIGFSVGGAGKPNAFGTFIGAILIGILQNGLVMLSVPYYAMDIVKGLVLAFALTVTYYKKKHR